MPDDPNFFSNYDPEPVDIDDDDDAEDTEGQFDFLPSVDPSVSTEKSERHWYVIHCYSGYENKVRHSIEQRIDTMGMTDKIFDVIVPTEEEIEVKDGKRKTVERRVFPGYILVEMVMDEDSWYEIGRASCRERV
jgi:transcription termination/antitermination protein NusG